MSSARFAVTEVKMRTIGIAGTGMIGTALAVLCTGHGMRTLVYARSEASAQRCRQQYRAYFDDLVAHGVMTEQQAACCESYLAFVDAPEGLADCEAVFEAIAEKVELKRELFARLEASCPKLQAICSASSSIEPDEMAQGLDSCAQKVLVTHPFNPAHMVPYMEICTGSRTSPACLAYVRELLDELDRKAVVLKKSTPGFIGNRLQFALLREAIRLVEEGVADPEDIDTCLAYSFCGRYTSIGLFEHFDNGGLQLCSAVCDNLFPILSDEKESPKLLKDHMAAGEMGVRSGQGFLSWKDVDMQDFRERMGAPFWKFCAWSFPEKPLGER